MPHSRNRVLGDSCATRFLELALSIANVRNVVGMKELTHDVLPDQLIARIPQQPLKRRIDLGNDTLVVNEHTIFKVGDEREKVRSRLLVREPLHPT